MCGALWIKGHILVTEQFPSFARELFSEKKFTLFLKIT